MDSGTKIQLSIKDDFQGRNEFMQKIVNLGWLGISGFVLIVALSGCAGGNSMNWPGDSINWPTSEPKAPAMTSSNGYIPRAQDCISIKQATPSQFVCHGKVYTAQQLQKIRETGIDPVASSSH
jgi:hypothetical protein